MNNEYTAVIKQDGDWWVGWIEEIQGVNCQEATYDELLDSLKITLQEALTFNREEALLNAGTDYREERIAL
ncbi:MAG: type II toxin-antitoxin system HicB family antitoxin [Methylococcales bacterium]|nr:type II toxin-antitoxin system HicB family antitoxin [Methylococcales bacterium]MDD5631153.1 type II toxin-antitoxin system HicB family antitoxin [Methylococcales bacterium]